MDGRRSGGGRDARDHSPTDLRRFRRLLDDRTGWTERTGGSRGNDSRRCGTADGADPRTAAGRRGWPYHLYCAGERREKSSSASTWDWRAVMRRRVFLVLVPVLLLAGAFAS